MPCQKYGNKYRTSILGGDGRYDECAGTRGEGMTEESERPPRVAPLIKAAPKIRSVYYCDLWKDAQLPEFWKKRPVIVVSYRNTLYGPCTVIPTSTDPQDDNPWAHRLSVRFDSGKQSWAVCNHPITVATSRLSQFRGMVPRVPEDDLTAVLRLLLAWLPKLPEH